MKINTSIVLLFLCVGSISAAESIKTKVVTTLPDLQSITEFVGRDAVAVQALARGYQDPHYVTPKPSLMAAVREADLFVEVGLDLELWTERVLDGARNAAVRVGNPGHVYAADSVSVRQKPKVISRAGGDLHPQGNPHVWLDPLNGKIIAKNIADGLKRVTPQNATLFDEGKATFDAQIDEKMFGSELVKLLGGDILTRLARQGELIPFLEEKEFGGRKLIERLGGWLGQSRAFRGEKILTFHQSWVYFAERFGLEIANTVEEKPGIPPSAQRKELLIEQVRKENIRVILVGNYYDDSVPRAIAEATGARVLTAPIMTGGVEEAEDYFGLFDYLIDALHRVYTEPEAAL